MPGYPRAVPAGQEPRLSCLTRMHARRPAEAGRPPARCHKSDGLFRLKGKGTKMSLDEEETKPLAQ
jgi:hypothetical protein